MATATILTRSIQGESLSSATDRLINTILLNEGVVDVAGSSFQVLQDTGSNMAVKVGSGTAFDRAVVEGDVAGQGTFILEHQNATQALTIAASDPSNPRIDGIDLVVKDDTFDSSTLDEADLIVTQGTPAGSPSAPAVPSSAIRLATVAVGAGVTAITNGNITDARTEALVPERVLDLEARIGQWEVWTPSFTNLTVGNGAVAARYIQVGKLVVARFDFRFGSTSSMGSPPSVSLPVTSASYVGAEDHTLGPATILDTGSQRFQGRVTWRSTTTLEPQVFTASGTFVGLQGLSATSPMTWVSGDALTFLATYEAA